MPKIMIVLGGLILALAALYAPWHQADQTLTPAAPPGQQLTGTRASAPAKPAPAGTPPVSAPQPAAQASAAPLNNYRPLTRKPIALSDQEWRALQEAAGEGPNREHELARMADYMVFQKKFMSWQSLPASAEPAQRAQLSAELLDEIPVKVAQGVLSTQQAMQIQEAVLTAMVPEPTRRAQLLEMAHRRLPAQPAAAPAFPH